MLRDSSSFERQIIDAVRSVNRALGGATGSTALNRSDYNQYEVQLIDAIRAIGRTLSGNGLSVAGGGGAVDMSGYATVLQFQDLSRRVTKLENESFFRLVDGNVTLKEEYQNLWVPGWLSAGGIGTGSSGGGGSSYLKELLDVYHGGNGVLRADGTAVVAGDALVYNATLGWVAAPGSGGGGSSVVVTQNTASGVQTTTITVDGVQTSIPVTAVSFGTQASDKIPITIGATTKNVLTAHQSLSGYVPTSRQVNGHPLTGDVTVTKGDIGLGNVENTKLSTWTGSQNITTLGTISTGVWNGTAIGVTKGGTGLTSIAKGAILYASANNVLSALAPNGTSTKKFLSQTGSNAPGWGTLSTSDITNIETWISGKAFATQSALDALSGTVDSLSSGLSSLSGRVDGLESDLSSLSSRVTSIEGWFEVVTVNGQSALHAKSGRAIYSDAWISAGGVGTGTGSGGASTLEELYDVSITSKSDGDIILYNSSTGRWINMRRANFLSGLATQTWVNNQGFLKTETDPTVPAWAKTATKPAYSFSEILNKPTTLAGYGITDGFKKTGGDISGDIFHQIEEEDVDSGEITIYELWKITENGEAYFDTLNVDGVSVRPRDYVTKANAQTITGLKTFTNSLYGKTVASNTDPNWYIDNDGSASFDNLQVGGSGVVTIANAQEITGAKTFSGGIVMNGSAIIPSADLGSALGYSNRRFSDINARTLSVKEINFKNSSNNAKTGYLSFGDGWMVLRSGANIDSSYKQLIFHETYGLYPENGSSINLGYYSSTDNRYRWANIYGVNEDLSGNLNVGGTISVNSINSIDQSNSGMSLFNYGARATKSFDAYGTSITLRAHNAQGTQINLLGVTAYGIVVNSTIRPNDIAGLNLGANNANGRWANIYGVNADLSGDLSLAQTSHIDIGPLRIEYDATNKALHITKKDGNDNNTYGLYADGFVSAGGVGQTS